MTFVFVFFWENSTYILVMQKLSLEEFPRNYYWLPVVKRKEFRNSKHEFIFFIMFDFLTDAWVTFKIISEYC